MLLVSGHNRMCCHRQLCQDPCSAGLDTVQEYDTKAARDSKCKPSLDKHCFLNVFLEAPLQLDYDYDCDIVTYTHCQVQQ